MFASDLHDNDIQRYNRQQSELHFSIPLHRIDQKVPFSKDYSVHHMLPQLERKRPLHSRSTTFLYWIPMPNFYSWNSHVNLLFSNLKNISCLRFLNFQICTVLLDLQNSIIIETHFKPRSFKDICQFIVSYSVLKKILLRKQVSPSFWFSTFQPSIDNWKSSFDPTRLYQILR